MGGNWIGLISQAEHLLSCVAALQQLSTLPPFLLIICFHPSLFWSIDRQTDGLDQMDDGQVEKHMYGGMI